MTSTYQKFAQNLAQPTPVKAAATSASQALPGRAKEMGANNGGGVSFLLDDWGVYDRFLLLGSEDPGYFVGHKDKTAAAFNTTIKCIKADGLKVVQRALDISLAGRAPKNDPAVVAIALAAVYGNDVVREAAYAALPQIARTGTWLFQFVAILDSLGKWNAAAKRGVSKWYLSKTPDRLAVQLLKYQQRDGWSHRDVLRLAHVKPTAEIQSLLKYSVKGAEAMTAQDVVPKLVIDFEALKRTDNKRTVLDIVTGNDNVTWEMVPTQWHKDKDVMGALLKNMGLTAAIRKLGILTQSGVIGSLTEGSKDVIAKLNDVEGLRKQRIHPITLIQAFKQYASGHGLKGDASWKADQRVLDALDRAFYASFKTIDIPDENYLFAVDCSGSMTMGTVSGCPNLMPVEVAGVMALAIANNLSNYFIGGFGRTFQELKISPSMRLDQVTRILQISNFGSTDASLAFQFAKQNKLYVDKFVTITDNDINTGRQPTAALNDYRKFANKASRSVVIATTMSKFTIADPKDPFQLDIGGFDSAAPQLIANL